MTASAEQRRVPVLLDDIIYRLQRFGGASDFWRELSRRLDSDPALRTRHVAGSSMERVAPLRANVGEVVHSSHFRVPWKHSSPCVMTIHDLTYERRVNRGRSSALNLWQRRHGVKRAHAIVCISDYTRSDLEDYYSDVIPREALVTTIHHGRTFAEPSRQPLPSRFGGGSYLLYVGNRGGYKNFATALAAFARSDARRQGMQLWCTGAALTSEESDIASRLRLTATDVHSLGIVATQELRLLYEHAQALVYPSRYEGFGLPPLDAMSLGCPVVGAAATSVSEIVGDAGLLVDPDDVDGMAAAIDATSQPETRSRLIRAGYKRAAGFSWERAAQQYASLYRELTN